MCIISDQWLLWRPLSLSLRHTSDTWKEHQSWRTSHPPVKWSVWVTTLETSQTSALALAEKWAFVPLVSDLQEKQISVTLGSLVRRWVVVEKRQTTLRGTSNNGGHRASSRYIWYVFATNLYFNKQRFLFDFSPRVLIYDQSEGMKSEDKRRNFCSVLSHSRRK